MSGDILDTFWAKGMLDRQRASSRQVENAQARCIDVAVAKVDELLGYCGVANDRIAALESEKAALVRKVSSLEADLVRRHEGYVRDRTAVDAYYAAQWERGAAEVRNEKAVILAEREGLRAQRDALRAELSRLAPGNGLLSPTGRSFGDGEPETGVDVVYAAAHAAAMTQMGYPPAERDGAQGADGPGD